MSREHEPNPRNDNGRSPRDFSDVGTLLSRPEKWVPWLAERPKRADLFQEAFSSVVRLESRTGWYIDVVLDQLGCNTKTEAELDELTEERLRQCIDYMKWVESLVDDSELDLVLDICLTVGGAAELFAAAENDLSVAQDAMAAGSFPATEYLRLGEVAQAWQQARRHLPGHEGDRARRISEGNPFMDEGTPHLTPTRLELLVRPDATEQLGRRTEAHIREHLRLCKVCESIPRERRQRSRDGQLLSTR